MFFFFLFDRSFGLIDLLEGNWGKEREEKRREEKNG